MRLPQLLMFRSFAAACMLGLLLAANGATAAETKKATAEKTPAPTTAAAKSTAVKASPAKSSVPATMKKAGSLKADLDFFERKIRPVLVAHCYECHSEKSKIVQANLYLDTREGTLRGGDSGPAVVPGKSEESLLVEALRFQSLEMPPAGKLPDEVIADFVKWVETGAADPRDGKAPAPQTVDIEAGRKFWAYQPPRASRPPTVKNQAWSLTQADRFVLAKLEEAGLAPSAEAEPEALIRRLTFDLTGLPPTADEVAAFVRNFPPSLRRSVSPSGDEDGETERQRDGGTDAYEALVDRLLASPRFGERWGRHWLDLARYAESSGKERNVPYRMAWRYRDYVIDAVNADMPYDQFIVEQLAGDQLESASTAERDRRQIATGFLSIGPRPLTERVPEKYALDVADEQLDTVCRVFLATTAACARCHDHKFDPIPTTDYYGLIGVFRSTENVCGVITLRREFSYSRATPLGDAALRDGPAKAYQDEIKELELAVDQLNDENRKANKLKDDALKADVAKRMTEAQARLAAARARAETEGPESLRFAMAVRDAEKPQDYAVRIRGEVDDLGPVVPRGFLSVLAGASTPKIAPERSGRLEMARWIASRDNPLTARVMINRIWNHLFGRGLVATTEDFGSMGERPSHPELLDTLAVEFMDDGWSVKRAIRRLVLSRTYRQASYSAPEIAAAGPARTSAAPTLNPEPGTLNPQSVDPDNRLLWRYARRRLSAEEIRDAVLSVSGELDLKRPYGSATLTIPNIELGSTARILAADDSPRYRAVYMPMLRGNVPEMLGLFDMADPSLVVGDRDTTTVATQALYLMNGPFLRMRAKKFAERILKAASNDEERIDFLYQTALARRPTADESRRIGDYLATSQADKAEKLTETDRWTDVCHALLTSTEFLYLR
jgi:hypothetical protein